MAVPAPERPCPPLGLSPSPQPDPEGPTHPAGWWGKELGGRMEEAEAGGRTEEKGAMGLFLLQALRLMQAWG